MTKRIIFLGDEEVDKMELVRAMVPNGRLNESKDGIAYSFQIQYGSYNEDINLEFLVLQYNEANSSWSSFLGFIETDLFVLVCSLQSPKSLENLSERILPAIERTVPKPSWILCLCSYSFSVTLDNSQQTWRSLQMTGAFAKQKGALHTVKVHSIDEPWQLFKTCVHTVLAQNRRDPSTMLESVVYVPESRMLLDIGQMVRQPGCDIIIETPDQSFECHAHQLILASLCSIADEVFLGKRPADSLSRNGMRIEFVPKTDTSKAKLLVAPMDSQSKIVIDEFIIDTFLRAIYAGEKPAEHAFATAAEHNSFVALTNSFDLLGLHLDSFKSIRLRQLSEALQCVFSQTLEQDWYIDSFQQQSMPLGADVFLQFGKSTRLLPCCSAFLSARCDFYRSLFNGFFVDCGIPTSRVIVIDDEGEANETAHRHLIQYIYTDKLPFDITLQEAIDLLVLADRMMLPRLVSLCEDTIYRAKKEQEIELDAETVRDLLGMAKHAHARDLTRILLLHIFENEQLYADIIGALDDEDRSILAKVQFLRRPFRLGYQQPITEIEIYTGPAIVIPPSRKHAKCTIM